ncbi:unnamed protein product [Cylicocyclus nassatus]|uniref:Annexin n=1 Tax=Cylicocyclus nassatus TaxID=53992 RepID=A0AA36GSN9_CYLNA|nr:unnamed protein product [Cylicocyclus nassatus]
MNHYATIVDNPDFDPVVYAKELDRAARANDKDFIVNMLTSISNEQRQMMRDQYKTKYEKDVTSALEGLLGGDLEKTILALMDTPLEYDVKQLKQAMKGSSTDALTLVEIFCSRTPDQLAAIRSYYEEQYGVPLEKDVGTADVTSGEFKDLFVALVTGSKDTSDEVDDQQAKDDAARLYGDGKAMLVSKGAPSYFLNILASQNEYQLRKVFENFADLSGITIEKAIENEFKGDLQKSFLTIVKAATDKQKFFAEQLYYSMKGLGTRDNDLIRVLVSRSEVDLDLIKNEFEMMYNTPLIDMIKGDTSGQYRDALLALITGNRRY